MAQTKVDRNAAKRKKEEADKTANKTAGDATSKKGGNPDNSQISGAEKVEEEAKPVYSIYPPNYPLSQKCGIPVRFTALATKVGVVEETFHCTAAVGGDRNKPKVVFVTNVIGNFITP